MFRIDISFGVPNAESNIAESREMDSHSPPFRSGRQAGSLFQRREMIPFRPCDLYPLPPSSFRIHKHRPRPFRTSLRILFYVVFILFFLYPLSSRISEWARYALIIFFWYPPKVVPSLASFHSSRISVFPLRRTDILDQTSASRFSSHDEFSLP